MKRGVRIVVFVALCIVALLGLLILLPFLKEGFSRSELPYLFLGSAIAIALALFWTWLARPATGWVIAGWLLLAAPAASYLTIGGDMLWQQFEADRLAASVKIENYAETPIYWPGFEGPVGLKIEFDLHHPENPAGLIYAPELRMGPELDIPKGVFFSTWTTGGGYFKDYHLEQPVGDLTLLKVPLHQELVDPRFANRGFENGRETRLAYHLYPGIVESIESRSHICLSRDARSLPLCATGQAPETGCAKRRRDTEPIYHMGDDLSALWGVAGPSDAVADLSGLLTSVLRQRSALQRHPDTWQAIQSRLEPAGLAMAGYALCDPGPKSHNSWRVCYCRKG